MGVVVSFCLDDFVGLRVQEVADVSAFGNALADERGADFQKGSVNGLHVCRQRVLVEFVASAWVY